LVIAVVSSQLSDIAEIATRLRKLFA
jgi:hypothetical protein